MPTPSQPAARCQRVTRSASAAPPVHRRPLAGRQRKTRPTASSGRPAVNAKDQRWYSAPCWTLSTTAQIRDSLKPARVLLGDIGNVGTPAAQRRTGRVCRAAPPTSPACWRSKPPSSATPGRGAPAHQRLPGAAGRCTDARHHSLLRQEPAAGTQPVGITPLLAAVAPRYSAMAGTAYKALQQGDTPWHNPTHNPARSSACAPGRHTGTGQQHRHPEGGPTRSHAHRAAHRQSLPEHMTRGEATVQCIEGKSSSWTAAAPSACTPVTSYTWRRVAAAPLRRYRMPRCW